MAATKVNLYAAWRRQLDRSSGSGLGGSGDAVLFRVSYLPPLQFRISHRKPTAASKC